MGKRNPYKVTPVKQLDSAGVVDDVQQQHVVVGVDVGKTKMVAAVMDQGEAVLETVGWSHPTETDAFLDLVEELRGSAGSVVVAMEPSGVYGDALRWQLLQGGFEVFRVSPKQSNDAREIFDGVPSSHDAKCAGIVAWLHFHGKSQPWPLKSEHERELKAALRALEVPAKQFRQNRNRLEGLTARYWPELTQFLDLDTATLLELLGEFGGPAGVADEPERAMLLMRRVGGAKLAAEKIEAVVASAARTKGFGQLELEVELVREIAQEARRNQIAERKARRRVERLAAAEGSTAEMQPVIGKTTAAVIVAAAGDPLTYDSPQAFRKSLGLNLREKSSGKKQGGLHITKRGSGMARMFLYMAALRLIQSDPIVRAWYAKKVRRDGGKAKIKAVVAVMRKIALALWHVARGDAFDSARLFDVRRLELSRTR